MTQTITPVLLCGGSGTRLWPLSRKTYPKQFVPLTSDKTMLQETALRVGDARFAPPVVVTSEPFRFIVAEQLQEIGITPQAILLEPEGRNTAPAVLAALEWLKRQDAPSQTVAVMPTDHAIRDGDDFAHVLSVAGTEAAQGRLVTLGISPTRPATGYGYIEPQSALDPAGTPVARFIEKPDHASAEQLIQNPDIVWNAGIFVFDLKTALHAFETHAPNLIAPVGASIDQAKSDFGFLRLDANAWSSCPDISIDYAIMEHALNVSVVPFASGWSDLGSWDAIWTEGEKDGDGVLTEGSVTHQACSDTLLRADKDVSLLAVGLRDIVVVAERDAVLVADRNQSDAVGNALKAMRAKGDIPANQARRDHRPWGWFESLVISEKFQVKQIYVKPGGTLSLQSHKFRAEHWVVVEGTAEVTIDDTVQLVHENQSVYVPLGSVHRMKNPMEVGMRLIEIQTGTYFGEDDITRYEDVYSRSPQG
ncbi:MAG: mannose-1-phosphate guanylyltransferase/mannose-6-phosphate isomerase [Pseudomonadota bacterium]